MNMKPHAEIRTVTKQLVDSLLAMNTSNRPLRNAIVEKYASDIKAGKWKITNQGIGVTVDGVLADGQHRLHAIKLLDYPPVPLLIVYGLDADSQIVIDSHAKRSARDVLQFAFGVRVNRNAPAIANVILKAKNNELRKSYSNHVLMDCISEYLEEIEIVANTPKSANFYAAPFLASFVIQMKLRPDLKDEIIKFMKSTEDGEMLDKTMPQYHLRNYIASSSKNSAGGEMQTERFIKCTKALVAYLKGEKMAVLRA